MRARSALVAAALLVVAGAGTAHAFDEEMPVLHSVTTSATSYAGGDTVDVTVDASDESGLYEIQVFYVDSAGKSHMLWRYGSAGQLNAAVVDDSWAEGPVKMERLRLIDAHDNLVDYTPDGRVVANYQGVTTSDVDLRAGEFSVHDSHPDLDPPALTSVTVETPTPATRGDVVTVHLGLVDDEHGAPDALVSVTDGAGKTHSSSTYLSGSTAAFSVDDSWADGIAKVDQVILTDHSGNMSVYDRSGMVFHNPQSIPRTPHDVDFDATAFPVLTAGHATPPVLLSVTRDTGNGYVEGDQISYRWTPAVSDPDQYVSVTLIDGSGKFHDVRGYGGVTTVTLDDTWHRGHTRIWGFFVSDGHGDSTSYDSRGPVYTWPDTVVTPPNLPDYDALGFDVEGPSVEVTGAPSALTTRTDASFSVRASKGSAPASSLSLTCALDGAPLGCAAGQVSVTGLGDGQHDFSATVTDALAQTSTTTWRWAVDTTAPALPVVRLPALALGAPALAWTATDTGSGISRSIVQWRSAGSDGIWSGYKTAASTASSVVLPLAAGSTVCATVRVEDRAGNPSLTTTQRCATRPLDDTAGNLSGHWSQLRRSDAYGGSLRRTTTAGDTLSFGPALFTKVLVLATTCPTCGSLAVFSGSTRIGLIDLRAATTRHGQPVVLTLPAARSGSVTLRTLTNRPVEIDGLLLTSR